MVVKLLCIASKGVAFQCYVNVEFIKEQTTPKFRAGSMMHL